MEMCWWKAARAGQTVALMVLVTIQLLMMMHRTVTYCSSFIISNILAPLFRLYTCGAFTSSGQIDMCLQSVNSELLYWFIWVLQSFQMKLKYLSSFSDIITSYPFKIRFIFLQQLRSSSDSLGAVIISLSALRKLIAAMGATIFFFSFCFFKITK